MSSIEISIRSIQHYLYCPHRWGLLEIDRAWAENAFVTKANLMHSRVHDPDKSYTARGKRVFTSVPVYHDLEEYNLYGITDCIEAVEHGEGVFLPELHKRCKLCIVEYKPTKPNHKDYHEADLMQVFAQKLCVDYVFGCDCDAVLYYANVKQRVLLPLRENFAEYDNRLRSILEDMRAHLQRGTIPPVRKDQNCSGCSMRDLCMPKIKGARSLKAQIEKMGEQEL